MNWIVCLFKGHKFTWVKRKNNTGERKHCLRCGVTYGIPDYEFPPPMPKNN